MTMLEETIRDYSEYLKLDVSCEIKIVQDVIDNMLTRLEELTSVLLMIKAKNNECNTVVSEDISKYRTEVSTLRKKVYTLNEVITKTQNNIESLEKQVEKAEADFGVNNDYKLKSLLMPFLKRNRETTPTDSVISTPQCLEIQSVLEHFEDKTIQQ